MNVTRALSAANRTLTATLTDSVTLESVTHTNDGAGGTSPAFSTARTYPARVHPGSPSSVDGAPAGGVQDVDSFTVVLSLGDPIAVGDRVKWVDPSGVTRTLVVTGVDESSWQIGRYASTVEAP